MYKEYEIKIKMTQVQWLEPKMKFLLGYNVKIVILWGGGGGERGGWLTFGGGNKDLVGKAYWGGNFLGGRGDEQIFGWWGGLPPIHPY